MSEANSYPSFQSIARWSREIVITEKIDGTNGLIQINEDLTMRVGSRNRWLTLGSDNFGFARWAEEHAEELRTLGPGKHYGEWWGQGIQRGYGLKEKRFSLFAVHKWINDDGTLSCPSCCGVVPVLATGTPGDGAVELALLELEKHGSVAAPGFMRPEGIVIYHTASKTLFKKTLEHDEKGKPQQ